MRADGKAVKVKLKATATSLSFTLAGTGARSAQITVSGGALKVAASLKRKVKAKRAGTLKATLAATDAARKTTTLTPSAKAG